MALIAVDLDHTLVEGDKPKAGAKEAINLIREAGHKIVIHSCNNPAWIKKALDNNDIRYDYIWGEHNNSGSKPLCDLYVDDKGYRFMGNWSTEVSDILKLVEELDNRKWTLKD